MRDLRSFTPATKTRILKTESRTSNVWKMCYKERERRVTISLQVTCLGWVHWPAAWAEKRRAKRKTPAPSKQMQLQVKAHSSVSGIQVRFSYHQWGTSVQYTICTAAVATSMLCRHLGGEDLDFTIEMAQQTSRTLGEDSHGKAHHYEISQPWG